ncbi:PREDICTED: 2-oxoisovalerate dehydrogenase subunit alpha, mitochondrial-like [Branchiostoma belcheri]|uniref:2-oxoisovalerate dehydrogenase subunit alpha n=1 Tax=Branchiostoma belcheri TaxID=7741 RepID=A0A6P4ZMS1_BRABE|nr:PREDICTED: 2-oxoisovalerate dehydrogenase subunit alpha, mitochondrial-like [Branchiostoma belcheri]
MVGASRVIWAVGKSLTTRAIKPSSLSVIQAPYRYANKLQSTYTASFDDDKPQFPGTGTKVRFTEKLDFLLPDASPAIPVYRVIDRQGEILDPAQKPELPEDVVLDIYRKMVLLNTLDTIMLNVQRQGRITFYMTSYGEEGTHMGSADVIFGQYREAGVFLWRGFTLDDMMNQCFSTHQDVHKGRMVPINYGSRDINFVSMSSPLATQIPQAAGAAYAMRMSGRSLCVTCYFGDGASSEGDTHAGFNFAATLDCPLLFFCRNNGYAISTPTSEQYRGDGVASRAAGYGISAIRVDGNDVFAVYNVTKAAREVCIKESKPVLIEAMTYRIGDHSTSDDSTTYRTSDEVHQFKRDSPITRLNSYLVKNGLWDTDKETAYREEAKNKVLEAFERAKDRKKPPISALLTDVYDSMPAHLERQAAHMRRHVNRYSEHYPVQDFLDEDSTGR